MKEEPRPKGPHIYNPETDGIIEVLNAGHRERQALLKWWGANPISALDNPKRRPFQWFMGDVKYDPKQDAFLMPDGTTVTIQECHQIE